MTDVEVDTFNMRVHEASVLANRQFVGLTMMRGMFHKGPATR